MLDRQAAIAMRLAFASWIGLGLGCGPTIDLDSAGGSGDMGTTEIAQTTGPTSTTMPDESTGRITIEPADSSTTVGPMPTDSGPDDTTAGPVRCPAVEGFACSAPIDCDGSPCGNVFSPFDAEGCMRTPCSGGQPCPDGEACFTPLDFGGCASSGLFCEDDPRVGCVCGGDADCGGSYCVPAGLIPPTDCSIYADPPTCEAAGCGPFVIGRRIDDAGGGACLCDLPEGLCTWVDPSSPPSPGVTLYYEVASDTVIKLAERYDPPPFGWWLCDELAPQPPACACARVLPCDL